MENVCGKLDHLLFGAIVFLKTFGSIVTILFPNVFLPMFF